MKSFNRPQILRHISQKSHEISCLITTQYEVRVNYIDLGNVENPEFWIEKHVLMTKCAILTLTISGLEVGFLRKFSTENSCWNWTRVTSRRNLLLIRGQILYLNLAHVFNHVFLQKSPQRKISWLPKNWKFYQKCKM